MPPGLATLFTPDLLLRFRDAFVSGDVFFAQLAPERIADLSALHLLQSLETLLASWPRPIEAHLPDLRDEASSIQVSATDARKVFANGMALLFSEANLVSPTLAAWLSTLRRDLDLSEQTYGRCLIYATPAEKGTAPHFDQNHNIVVQIHGTKRWELATNEHVIHPLTRHTIGQVEDPELATYCESAMPRAMPSKRQTIDLVPGSILYVPRGMWHQTTSIGESLALNFTFTAPCWADLFVGALRSRLILSPAWRETAQGLIDPRNAREATRHLDALLADLVDDLPNWRAQEILAATESEYPFGDA